MILGIPHVMILGMPHLVILGTLNLGDPRDAQPGWIYNNQNKEANQKKTSLCC